MLKQGSRVQTPLGPGTVQWWRNAPPDYAEPGAVSVLLDEGCELQRGYSGTVFPIECVTCDADEMAGDR